MKKSQRGMTLIGFILTLAVVGVFIYMGMKVIPMYMEYHSVKNSLQGLARDPEIEGAAPAQVRDMFMKRLDINYATGIKPEHIKIVRQGAGQMVTVEYEVRRPLIHNLDIVGRFRAEQELRRGAAVE